MAASSLKRTTGPLYVGAAFVGYFYDLDERIAIPNLLIPAGGGEVFRCTVRLLWLGRAGLDTADFITGPLFFRSNKQLESTLAGNEAGTMSKGVPFLVCSQIEMLTDSKKNPLTRLQTGLSLDEYFNDGGGASPATIASDETRATCAVQRCEEEYTRLEALAAATEMLLQPYQAAHDTYQQEIKDDASPGKTKRLQKLRELKAAATSYVKDNRNAEKNLAAASQALHKARRQLSAIQEKSLHLDCKNAALAYRLNRRLHMAGELDDPSVQPVLYVFMGTTAEASGLDPETLRSDFRARYQQQQQFRVQFQASVFAAAEAALRAVVPVWLRDPTIFFHPWNARMTRVLVSAFISERPLVSAADLREAITPGPRCLWYRHTQRVILIEPTTSFWPPEDILTKSLGSPIIFTGQQLQLSLHLRKYQYLLRKAVQLTAVSELGRETSWAEIFALSRQICEFVDLIPAESQYVSRFITTCIADGLLCRHPMPVGLDRRLVCLHTLDDLLAAIHFIAPAGKAGPWISSVLTCPGLRSLRRPSPLAHGIAAELPWSPFGAAATDEEVDDDLSGEGGFRRGILGSLVWAILQDLVELLEDSCVSDDVLSLLVDAMPNPRHYVYNAEAHWTTSNPRDFVHNTKMHWTETVQPSRAPTGHHQDTACGTEAEHATKLVCKLATEAHIDLTILPHNDGSSKLTGKTPRAVYAFIGKLDLPPALQGRGSVLSLGWPTAHPGVAFYVGKAEAGSWQRWRSGGSSHVLTARRACRAAIGSLLRSQDLLPPSCAPVDMYLACIWVASLLSTTAATAATTTNEILIATRAQFHLATCILVLDSVAEDAPLAALKTRETELTTLFGARTSPNGLNKNL